VSHGSTDTARLGTFLLRRRIAEEVDEVVGPSGSAFAGRAEAGLLLRLLLPDDSYSNPIVLAIPPGGVVVGEPVADQLNAPLEALVVESLQLPGSKAPNLLGAIAPGASRLLGADRLKVLHLQPWAPEFLADCRQGDLARLEGLYREGRMAPQLDGRSAILVDDGLTSSLGVLAAVDSVRGAGAARVIFAAPLVSDPLRAELIREGVEVVRLAGDRIERAGIEHSLYGDEPVPSAVTALAILKRAARRVPGAWDHR
jgi:predicted phosphoribosyltransferase